MIARKEIVAKSQELHQVVDELVAIVADAVRDHTPIHEVEGKSMKVLLLAGRKALQLLVDCLGNGDMGQEHQLPDGTTVKRSAEPEPRDYVLIFGKIDIERYVYARRKGQAIEFAAIDARLALPAGFDYMRKYITRIVAKTATTVTISPAAAVRSARPNWRRS